MKKFITVLSIVAVTSVASFAQDDPFSQMEKFMQTQIEQMKMMHQQMSKYFNQFGNSASAPIPVSFNTGGIMSSGFEDKGNHYELKIKIDDLKNSKVQMSISGNILSINVQEHKKIEKKDKNIQLVSYNDRTYSQSFTLPPNVDTDKIDATQKGDMIIVSIPKKNPPKEVKIRKIEDTNSSKK